MTFNPSHPRPGGSSAQHIAPPPSPTPPPPHSWRSVPRPKRSAPRPATSQSPHPRPTDRPRPGQNDTRIRQQRPRPPTNPRCQPTYSACPATAAATSPNPTPRLRPCAHTRESTSARAPSPRALPAHRTTRNPPDTPPPPVPTTPTHPPTPIPPLKTAGPPRNSGCSAGRTRSSGSCETGPVQSPPSRAWSTGPARGRWRTAASGRRGGGCRRPHGKPGWPMRYTPWESIPATSPRSGPPVCPGTPAGDPPGDTTRWHPPSGHHPKPNPTHTHPLTTPQASAHQHQRHPQHPSILRATQHDAPDPPASGAAT